MLAEGDEEEENTDFFEVLELGREGKEREIKIGEHLPEHQKDELKASFAEYTDVLSAYPRKTDLIKCKLMLKDESPCKQAPYGMPDALKPAVVAEIIKLLENGFIVECDSDFSSPLVVVRKRDGSIRLCCNYIALNERLVDDHYITANSAEILSSAAGAAVVSTIDLKQAFWQVELEEDSVKYTSFRCFVDSFAWTRMPFGLQTSPKILYRLIDKILRGIRPCKITP